jgi:hypothetical protein
MTEEEWLESTDPKPMLEFLRGPELTETKVLFGTEVRFSSHPDRRTSERKARLFACAVCRKVWHLLAEENVRRGFEYFEWLVPGLLHPIPLHCCRNAVELSERNADGENNVDEMKTACEYASQVGNQYELYTRGEVDEEDNQALGYDLMATAKAAHAVRCASGGIEGFHHTAENACQAVAYSFHNRDLPATTALTEQCDLLRDLSGNPFRLVSIQPAWLTPTVLSLASVAYEERHLPSGELDTSRLAVLADALEDAGCTNADVLGHLRSSGPHVRGCWALDLLLRKE